MTTVYASSLVPISHLFPKTASAQDNAASAVDTSPINSLEAAAEDSASAGLNIAQMLASDMLSGSGSTSPADALFGATGGGSLNVLA